jgi:dTDP-4-amino-4,6-dideoxygalactose transaminase
MVPHNSVCLRPEDAGAVAIVVRSGQIGQGPQVEAFEHELAERFRPGGAAACVSSGTAAIRLAINVLGLEYVTLPTYACVALYHAVNDGVSKIALVDCTPWTLCSPAASVVVDTYGTPCAIMGSIEDFTHAPGAAYQGEACGSRGAASVISFGATKPLGCGAGGAVLGSPELIAAVKDIRDYDGKRELRVRFNWQMSDMTAVLGRHRLRRLDEENAWRSKTAEQYAMACRDGGFGIYASGSSIFYRFVIHVQNVEAAIRRLAENGVEAINPLWNWELLHWQMGLTAGGFPHAETAVQHTVSLPIWPGMQDEQVRCVVEAIKRLERA